MKILTVMKTELEKYCSIKTSHTGVNNMWIVKVPLSVWQFGSLWKLFVALKNCANFFRRT